MRKGGGMMLTEHLDSCMGQGKSGSTNNLSMARVLLSCGLPI